MQNALETLGYRDCYHFSSMHGNVKDCDMWMEAFRAKYSGRGQFGREQWDQLLGHCAAVTDSPCQQFAPELIEAYPEAKVVLVERDVESWHGSWTRFVEAPFNPFLNFLRYTDPRWFGRIQQVGMTWMETQIHARNLRDAKHNAQDVYKAHYDMVRGLVTKDKLLEYKLGSGWEPLCAFLGKDIPQIPFPHINESQTMKAVFVKMGIKAMQNTLWNLVMLLSATMVVFIALRYPKGFPKIL